MENKCGICKKFELVRKKKSKKIRSYPRAITLTEAAKNIKESAKLKESYNDLYLEIPTKPLNHIHNSLPCYETY